jgi:probable rRNA maturation factor
MSRTLSVRNRQRVRRVNTPLLRRIALHVLEKQLRVSDFELAIHLVAAPEMARVNKAFLQHEGSTDVITFDHSDLGVRLSSGAAIPASWLLKNPSKPAEAPTSLRPGRPHSVGSHEDLHGEIFICLNDAVKQALEFRTTWQGELTRYVIHGLLHLCGHDDLQPAARRIMKREENRVLRAITKRFALSEFEIRSPNRRARQSAIGNPKSAI